MIDLHSIAGRPDRFFLLVCLFIVMCSATAVLAAVAIDFRQFRKRAGVKQEQKSIVETGSMLLFFFLFYIVLITGTGSLAISVVWLQLVLAGIGTLAVVAGCYVNIRGRFDLGKNWSNQIRIYRDHTLVTSGMYKIVRHPLYASLVWMFIGASLLYANLIALLSVLLVFLPFMYYRAKQEEQLLKQEFKGYEAYRKKVGMFFPKP